MKESTSPTDPNGEVRLIVERIQGSEGTVRVQWRLNAEAAYDFFEPHSGELLFSQVYMSSVVRKPAFCICENKYADQLRGNREADQRLCFRYTDSTIPLLPKSEISSL